MELLFNRSSCRAEKAAVGIGSKDDGFVVKDGSKHVFVSKKALNFDLAGTLDLAPDLVEPLALSLWCMLQVSPFLVSGYQYIGRDVFIKMPETAEQEGFLSRETLIRRWCADTGHADVLAQGKMSRWIRGAEAGCRTEVGGC